MATGAPTTQAILAADASDLEQWPSLARRQGESAKQYAAFLDYVRMGPGRSLRKLSDQYRRQIDGDSTVQPPTKTLRTLEKWSSANEWQKRLAAYQQERADRDQAIWEERRRAVNEADFATGDALRELGNQILAQTPQFLKTTRRLVKGGEGAADREVITVELDGAFMAKLFKLASDLQRQASGIDVQKHEHSGPGGGPIRTQGSQVHLYLPDNERSTVTGDGSSD